MSILSPNFLIGNIRIGTVSDAACVNLGNNFPTDFTSFKKHTQGFGEISGDSNDIHDLKSALTESSLIDMINQADDEDIPGWIKEIVHENMLEGITEEEDNKISDDQM